MQISWRRLSVGITCALLAACAGKETKLEEAKSRYDVEIDENVKGEDSALRSGTYSLSLLREYHYDHDQLLSEMKSASSGKKLEDRVKVLTIRRMLGQKSEAINGLLALLESHPGNKLILQNLANAYLDLGEYEMARFILFRLLSQAKGDAALHNNLGVLFYKTGDLSEAILAWKRSVKLVPTHVDARLNLAAVAMEHGNYDDSFQLCDDVLKNESRNADAYLCKCTSIMGQGKFKEADECYSSAESRVGKWEALYWNRAFALYRLGKFKEAKERIERYLVTRRRSLNPKSPIFAFLQQLSMEMRAAEQMKQQAPSPTPDPEPTPDNPPAPEGQGEVQQAPPEPPPAEPAPPAKSGKSKKSGKKK